MKKITTIPALTFLAMAFTSCSKSSSELTRQSITTQVVAATASTSKKIIGDWVYPQYFTIESDRLNGIFMKGHYFFSAITQISYNKDTHVELIYVRRPYHQRQPYRYERMPFNTDVSVNGNIADVFIDYSLDPDGLKVYFRNADYTALGTVVSQSSTESWRFRYIIIPKTLYQSINIDWNDLRAVAVALNFTL